MLRQLLALGVAGLLMVLPRIAAPSVAAPELEGNGVYFGEPLPNLSQAQLADYLDGFTLFIKVWPTVEGAKVNAKSCAACHRIPLPGGSGTTSDTFVLHASTYRDIAGGTVLPRFLSIAGGALQPLENNFSVIPAVFRRKTQPLFGLGLLEAVEPSYPSQTRKQSSGRLPCDSRGCGRFGWKSTSVSIADFVERAFSVELGLTIGKEDRALLSKRDVQLVSQFIRFLAAPPRLRDDGTMKGRQLFYSSGCATCHSPSLVTGPSAISALSRRKLACFTDLLLHDMGDELTESSPEGNAAPTEYRTPPLWGLRFTGPPYLHDGRAPSIEAAIEAHTGEGKAASSRFKGLSQQERDAIVLFLRTL